MTLDFAGRVTIVTGAGRGMGRAVAARLAAGGAKLVVNDLDVDSAERTACALRESGAEALAAPGDVTSSADVARMVSSALGNFGRIHVLINNAGVLRPTPVFDIEEEEWDMVVNGNLKSTYLCSRAVLPTMRDQAGAGS